MATTGSIFGAMLQEFDGAARILNLEPGNWKILTTPKRQITVSCPAQMDNGDRGLHRVSRAVHITLGPVKGASGITRSDAGPSHGARVVDDVEMGIPARRRTFS
jgi:glutamate dehydrogenase/leucine dehydrogenase